MPCKNTSSMPYSHTIHEERELATFHLSTTPTHHLTISFVFDNYTWNRDGPIYSNFNGNLIPSTIPMTVQIAGTSSNTSPPPSHIHVRLQDPWPVALSLPVTIHLDPL